MPSLTGLNIQIRTLPQHSRAGLRLLRPAGSAVTEMLSLTGLLTNGQFPSTHSRVGLGLWRALRALRNCARLLIGIARPSCR